MRLPTSYLSRPSLITSAIVHQLLISFSESPHSLHWRTNRESRFSGTFGSLPTCNSPWAFFAFQVGQRPPPSFFNFLIVAHECFDLNLCYLFLLNCLGWDIGSGISIDLLVSSLFSMYGKILSSPSHAISLKVDNRHKFENSVIFSFNFSAIHYRIVYVYAFSDASIRQSKLWKGNKCIQKSKYTRLLISRKLYSISYSDPKWLHHWNDSDGLRRETSSLCFHSPPQ